MQLIKSVPATLLLVLSLASTGACHRPAVDSRPVDEAVAWLPAGCEWIVLWNGTAWQGESQRALLDRVRGWPAWQRAWNPVHDDLLGKPAAAAFSATDTEAPTLLFLGSVGTGGTPPRPSCLQARPELARALPKRHTGTLLRFAAELPLPLRQELAGGTVPFAPALASVMRVAGSLEWRDTVILSLRFELSNRPDAQAVAAGLSEYRDAAKQHPDLLLLGLGPHLEALSVAAQGTNVVASVDMGGDEAMALVDTIGRRLSAQKRP